MNVSLTPELDKYVHGKVASGRYSSASEVVREALRAMVDREQSLTIDQGFLRRKIEIGFGALEKGDYVDATPDEHVQETLRLARERNSL